MAELNMNALPVIYPRKPIFWAANAMNVITPKNIDKRPVPMAKNRNFRMVKLE